MVSYRSRAAKPLPGEWAAYQLDQSGLDAAEKGDFAVAAGPRARAGRGGVRTRARSKRPSDGDGLRYLGGYPIDRCPTIVAML